MIYFSILEEVLLAEIQELKAEISQYQVLGLRFKKHTKNNPSTIIAHFVYVYSLIGLQEEKGHLIFLFI